MSEQQFKAEVMDELEASEDVAAPTGRLWRLWHAVLNALTDYMTNTPREKQRAGTIAVAIKFLADNGITLDAKSYDATAEGLKQLAGMTLPFNSPEQ